MDRQTGKGKAKADRYSRGQSPRSHAFLGLSEDDLRVTVLAEHALEGDVGENLLPADGTPEELEQCLTVLIEYFETYR